MDFNFCITDVLWCGRNVVQTLIFFRILIFKIIFEKKYILFLFLPSLFIIRFVKFKMLLNPNFKTSFVVIDAEFENVNKLEVTPFMAVMRMIKLEYNETRPELYKMLVTVMQDYNTYGGAQHRRMVRSDNL